MGLFGVPIRYSDRQRRAVRPAVDGLERRELLAAGTNASAAVAPAAATAPAIDSASLQLTTSDVNALLQRAAAASASTDAIIAVVDRAGNILGVRVESGVSPAITGNNEKLVFAVYGAVAEARTGAFFASNPTPLTSRTIQDISQTTMTARLIQSDPNITDPNSPLRGPGFVAPVGVKGHFPPGVQFTPQVDLFNIEASNRDSILHPGADHLKGPGDVIQLPSRFNVPLQYIPPGQQMNPPESYGFVSGKLPFAQARGIGTLPGGIPLFKNDGTGRRILVGGIGVFFPGTTGYATEENSKLNDAHLYNPHKRDRAEEAEFMAFVASGGSPAPNGAGYAFNGYGGAPALVSADGQATFGAAFGRIDLVGITLDIFGGHGLQGISNLLTFGHRLGIGNPNDGTNLPVNNPVGNIPPATALPGTPVPTGWLVAPHDGTGLTAADVVAIVNRGIAEANQVRAAIRVSLDSTAKMVFAVSDKDGNILGLYRMPDATVFSIDVAVAKSRNVAYYANANLLQPQDQIKGVPAGTAFTSRTFRYVTLPHFPEGIDVYPPGPFSILNSPGTFPNGGTKVALPPSAYTTNIQGFDAFNPGSNFHDPLNPANQDGIVFFPGSAPLYKDITGSGTRQLVGGLGVSGDGVDQDDDVTYEASLYYQPPAGVLRADMVKVRGIRLPYNKFNRQPHEPFGQKPLANPSFVHKIPSPKGGRKK